MSTVLVLSPGADFPKCDYDLVEFLVLGRPRIPNRASFISTVAPRFFGQGTSFFPLQFEISCLIRRTIT